MMKIIKEKAKAFVSILLMLMLIFTCFPNMNGMAYGETVSKYNVTEAVNYAKAHYNDAEQDCTVFLRACLEAGGVPRDPARDYGYTVEDYVDYLLDNGYAEKFPLKLEKQDWETPQWYVRAADNADVLSVGDGVLYYCNKCKNEFHVSLATGIDGNGFIKYYAQNVAVADEVLCAIDCPKCEASRENISLYSLHLTTPEHGYSTEFNGTTVSNIKARRTADNEITITWDKVSGAAGYKIFVKNGKNSVFNQKAELNETSYVFTEPNPGEGYYFAVRPYFVKDGKRYVGKMSATVYNNEFLLAPTEFTAKLDTGNVIRLSWKKVYGADEYEVYRSTSKTGTFVKVFTGTGTTFNTENVVPGTTYYFKVKAINKSNPAGNSPFSATASVTTSNLEKPKLTITNTDTGFKVTWDKIKGADKYKVYRATSENGSYTVALEVTGTSYNTNNVENGKTYYIKVEAVCTANTKANAMSDVAKTTWGTEPEQPDPIDKPVPKAGNSVTGKPQLTWEKVDGATKYEIYRSGYKDGTYTKMFTTTATSYTNTSANAGYIYYYKVKAVGNGTSATSDPIGVRCLSVKPEVTAGNSSTGKPQLTWEKVPGATKYEIYRSGYKDGTYTKMFTTTATSYTNTSANAGYIYYYKVKAVGNGTSATSDPIGVRCLSVKPEVTAGNSSTGKPQLTWEKVPGATKYEIYRSGYSNGTYTKMFTTTNTSYTNTSAKEGYTYFYKVKAIMGNESVTSDVIKAKCLSIKPEITKVSNNSNGYPTLEWDKVPGATKYEIYRSGYSNGTYTKMFTTTGTTYTNTSAKQGYTYYYKVKAITSSGNLESDVVSAKCIVAKPVISKVGNSSDGKPQLTWATVPGATKYEIYRSGYKNGTYTKMFTTTKTTYTNTSAKSGYIYYYKVVAVGSSSSNRAESDITAAKCK